MFHHTDRTGPTDSGSEEKPRLSHLRTRLTILACLSAGILVAATVVSAVCLPATPGLRAHAYAAHSSMAGQQGSFASSVRDGLRMHSQEELSDESSEDGEETSEVGWFEEWLAALFPDHGFHPLVIHFPIALFVFGTLLEIVGWWWGDFRVRQAAFWNLAAGSLSTLIVIPTGAIAFMLSDYTWKGIVVYHMAFAGAAAILMAATVLWRRKGPHTSWKYLAVLIASTVALGIAGYFGGELIYGL